MEIPLQIDTELLTGPWDCTIEEYHADRQWLSHSALEIFIESPKKYKNWYDGVWKREMTAALRLGSAVDAMLLEPDTFEKWFTVLDVTTRNTTKYRNLKEIEKREILLRAEFNLTQRMVSAIKSHSWIDEMVSEGRKQATYRYIDPDFGIPCKVRTDLISEPETVVDVKTSRNPAREPWVRDAAKYGYHRQEVFYLRGLKAANVFENQEPIFFHVVVGSVEPHDVFAYQLDSKSLEMGVWEVEEKLRELKERRDKDNWKERNYGEVETVSLPGWYFNKGWEE